MGLPKEVHHDFNWTFTTEYHGTIKTKDVSENSPSIVTDPPEKLNLEKLMQREKILFYEELTLYEDELHDNGISNLSVKIVCSFAYLSNLKYLGHGFLNYSTTG